MAFWNWFKPKNKTNVVLPTEDNTKLLHGLDLVKAFTTDTEPKVADYHKSQYAAYWETVLETIDGGYRATVRFYSTNGLAKEVEFKAANVPELKDAVNSEIRKTMLQYKR